MIHEYLIKAVALTYEETIQVPVLDEDGNPTYDEETGEPIMEDKVIDVPYYPKAQFRSVILTGMVDDEYVLDILHTEDPTLPQDSLIGAWNQAGERVAVLDQAAFEAIRPLGNNADGTATKELLWHHFSGWGQRQLGDEASPDPVARNYPTDNTPFQIIVGHFWYDQAEFSGWGFLAEIKGGADSRDPSARAMGVYSDPECTQYLWTGGAFQLGPSRLGQVDGEGEPLQVWFSDTPAGFRTTTQEDWHLACLLGSAQEGFQTLSAIGGTIEYLFWEHGQAPPPSGSDWVDSGATVVSQAGTLYQISDPAVVAGLVAGQPIRLGDTAETTFTGVWAGGADYIEIDPFVQASIGEALWIWE